MTRRRKQVVTLPPVAWSGSPPRPPADPDMCRGISALPEPIREAMSRGYISTDQYRAAKRYAADHQRAISIPECRPGQRVTTSAAPSPFALSKEDRRIVAARSFQQASHLIRDELSKDHRRVLDRVVLDEVPANRAAAEAGLQPRGGISLVRAALDRLIEFYAAEDENARARD